MSYASINRNQNNPYYCESSWAHAATSALNDRFALLKNASYPEVVLSAQVPVSAVLSLETNSVFQVLLNCVGTKDTDGCRGGEVHDAYKYIKDHSLPDESCSPYEAKPNECTDIHVCKSCWPDKCYALRPGEYTPYTIKEYYRVNTRSEGSERYLCLPFRCPEISQCRKKSPPGVLSPVVSVTRNLFFLIAAAFSQTRRPIRAKQFRRDMSCCLGGERRTVLDSGSVETAGVHTGEKWDGLE